MPRAAFAAVLVAAAFGFAPPASASAPVITLLTPANGATLAIPAYQTDETKFSWRISWDAPEGTIVQWQISSDPNFAPGTGTGENRSCTAADVNCFSSYAPPRSYSPPYPKLYYWRVGLTTSAGVVWSAPSMFKVVNLADLVKPRVRVFSGSARRGSRAYVRVRAADNRGRVRLRVTLQHQGRTLYSGQMGWTTTYWANPLLFYTRTPLPRFLPVGRYRACVKAWDEAGNSTLSCAPYRVR